MTRRILWVDDDGPRRFRYEDRLLRKRGWEPIWAIDIAEAVKQLAEEPFAGLILDQSLPFRKHKTPTGIEGGYILLHWLRNGTPPEHYDLPGHKGVFDSDTRPLVGNTRLPVVIFSGYYDVELANRIRQLSALDAEIEIAPKPIDDIVVLSYLELLENATDAG